MLKIRTVLGKLGKALLLLCFLFITYLFVILLNPEPSEPEAPQPLAAASPAQYLQDAGGLSPLISSFPVPVLAAGGETVLQLQEGVSRNAAFENGFGRVLILEYLYGEIPVEVTSIYPARALELLGRGDWHMSTVSAPLLAGWNAVRMENKTEIRLHMQTGYGIYAVRIPKQASAALTEILRPLQLMTAGERNEE